MVLSKYEEKGNDRGGDGGAAMGADESQGPGAEHTEGNGSGASQTISDAEGQTIRNGEEGGRGALGRQVSRWIQVTSEAELPYEPGIYVLFAGSTAMYVGMSVTLRGRFRGHGWSFSDGGILTREWGLITDGKLKVRKARRYGEQAMAEMRLLYRLKPIACSHPKKKISRLNIADEPLTLVRSRCLQSLVSLHRLAKQCGMSESEVFEVFRKRLVLGVPVHIVRQERQYGALSIRKRGKQIPHPPADDSCNCMSCSTVGDGSQNSQKGHDA